MNRAVGFLGFALTALLLLPTCRTTKHTVARIVTPPPTPTEIFVPLPTATPAVLRLTAAAPPPTPTRTIAPMRVATAPPRYERSPGVLYEELVPTVAPATPAATPTARPRATRSPRTPTPAATQKPGVYYEDEQGRPLTPTPSV